MPVAAKALPLEDLATALDYHALKTGRGAMLEYLLIDGVNDSLDAADALASWCLARAEARTGEGEAVGKSSAAGTSRPGGASNAFVNLIPYNPTLAGGNFGFETPSDERVNAFHQRLRDSWGVNSLVRWTSTSGRDADGACGQLALSVGAGDGNGDRTTNSRS